jgi:hypothetical protein
MLRLDGNEAWLAGHARAGRWIAAPRTGTEIEHLHAKVDTFGSREAINDWIEDALAERIDPLCGRRSEGCIVANSRNLLTP